MDLATIQKYYDEYKLYYVVGNADEGRFIPITNLRATWNASDNFIVIVSLHIGGFFQDIINYLNNLGYDQAFIQNEINKGYFSKETIAADPNLQAIFNREVADYRNIINNYLKTPILDASQQFQANHIITALRDLPKNTITSTTLRKGKKLQLTTAPSELICSDALMEYNRISYPGNENKFLITYLMEQPPSFIANVLGNLGIDKINGSIDVFYELAFFLNRFDSSIIHLNRDDVSYISSLDIDQLIAILMISNGQRYQYAYSLKPYPWGHVYLMYTVLTGNMPPNPFMITTKSFDRYKVLVPVEPYKIAALAFYFYGPRTATNQYASPYKYIAVIKNVSPLEEIVLSSSLQDVDQLINQNQMVPPPNVQSLFDKFYYFAGAVKLYNTVFTRPLDLQPPGSLIGMDYFDARDLLLMYTDRELLDRYPIPDIRNNRSELILLIFFNYRGTTWWELTKDCKNDDTLNVIEDELHGAIDKNNKLDPTFSYGTYHNYRCYQTSELIASFHEDESGFHFTVPDWINPGLNIGREGSDIEEFSGKSMLQLLEVIGEYLEDDESANIILQPLIDKINLGLTKLDIIREELAHNIQVYQSFDETDKQWATICLVWLFLFSMWMRFWKGPGHPYPFTTKSGESPIRDEHIILQLYVRDIILERGGKSVKEWIEQLPIIKFDWKRKTNIKIEPQGSLNKMIIKVQEGTECQGIAGDTLSTTAYSLIKHMFNYDIDQFNEFINEWTPQINNIEKEVIMRQLPVLTQQIQKQPIPERTGILWKIYNARLEELTNPIIKQEPFDPDKMEYTQHV